MRVVLDTCVLTAGLRSRDGASFQILSKLGKDAFQLSISVPLLLEYEDVLCRPGLVPVLTKTDISDFLDFICSIASHQKIDFLWRPQLKDPGDDAILELAVNAQAQSIVTFNTRDFAGSEKFGIQILTPSQFLKIIRP